MAHKPICQDIKADQEHVFHYQVDAAEVKHSNSYILQERGSGGGLWEPGSQYRAHAHRFLQQAE